MMKVIALRPIIYKGKMYRTGAVIDADSDSVNAWLENEVVRPYGEVQWGVDDEEDALPPEQDGEEPGTESPDRPGTSDAAPPPAEPTEQTGETPPPVEPPLEQTGAEENNERPDENDQGSGEAGSDAGAPPGKSAVKTPGRQSQKGKAK